MFRKNKFSSFVKINFLVILLCVINHSTIAVLISDGGIKLSSVSVGTIGSFLHNHDRTALEYTDSENMRTLGTFKANYLRGLCLQILKLKRNDGTDALSSLYEETRKMTIREFIHFANKNPKMMEVWSPFEQCLCRRLYEQEQDPDINLISELLETLYDNNIMGDKVKVTLSRDTMKIIYRSESGSADEKTRFYNACLKIFPNINLNI